ncbi:MAG: cobyrinate a,c-diamide synthase, partial [Planctomycetota bacterium]
MSDGPPRLVVAGTGGDSGKTLVSLGLVGALRRSGRQVAAFKKGPDYIDAAWLTRAAGRPARNLDAWIMGVEAVKRSFLRHAEDADVCVVEGNRGLFDGLEGTSTAALARSIDAPVVLVLNLTKVTRTVAAFVAGVPVIDPDVRLAGVILNRVGGVRHEREAREAVEQATGVPVLGAIPRLDGPNLLPDRHLGLVPPSEHERMDEVVDRLAQVIREHADLETLLDLSRAAGPAAPPCPAAQPRPGGSRVRVGVFRDAAFTFYYPENLEALEEEGAELVPVSPLADPELPDVDLLYVGGGFPETHATDLASNRSMNRSVRAAAADGLPIFAECGGLIYLSRSVEFEGRRWPLSGVLDVDTEVRRTPQGHGYAEAVVSRPNP